MTSTAITRRTAVQWAAAGTVSALGGDSLAADAGWLPYDPAEVTVLMPHRSDSFARAVTEFLPAPDLSRELHFKRLGPSAPPVTARKTRGEPAGAAATNPPTAYTLTAQRSGVPAWLLFGVALQESQLAFGRETLPYPWTLCVRGRGERHASYEQTLERLKRHVRAGVTNVDCGAMQVNWHHHQDKLQSFERALDPYPNLAVGADILRNHYLETGNWFGAVGLYHTGSTRETSTRERARRYARGVFARLDRLGVSWQPAGTASGAQHG